MNRRKIIRKRRRATLFWICVLASVFLDPGCSGISPKLQNECTRGDLSQDMQALFDDYRQSIPKMMADHKIPGLSIAVVDRDSILWTAGFGYTDYDRKTPVTPETIFSIQSMSKTFTATAVMFAVQDELVELDTPITEYLPDFRVNSRFEDKPQDKITLRHLLTHTAGFSHEAPIGNNMEVRCASFNEHVKSISDTWLKHSVGEKYSYSNMGMDLAAYILQVRSGKPFPQYLKEKLFEPLGMTNSSANMEFIRRHPNRAIGHRTHFKEVPLIPMTGAGGVYTNAKELARFVQFHLNLGKVNGRMVLEETLIRSMYTQSSIAKYGPLGIGYKAYDGYGIWGFGGGGFGFLTGMGWSPEYAIGILVLTNSQDHDNQHVELALNVILRLFNEKLVEKRYSFDITPCKVVNVENGKCAAYQPPNSDNFTRYQPAWKKHVGTYRYLMNGWKLHTYASIALALGYPDPGSKVKVYEKNGYLEVNGERLDEHLPGLFFTDGGECLDFRGSMPTWQNLRMKKIR